MFNLVSVLENESNRLLICCSSLFEKPKTEPAGPGPHADILLPGQQKDAKVPSPSGGHIFRMVSVDSIGC